MILLYAIGLLFIVLLLLFYFKSKDESRFNKTTSLIQTIIIIITIVFSIISYKSTNDSIAIRDTILDSLNYQIKSIQYIAKLKPIKLPSIDYFYINPKDISKTVKIKETNSIGSAPINLEISYALMNIGSSDSKILFQMVSDSITDKPFLREDLLSQLTKRKSINDGPFPAFFNNEIIPGDSLSLELKYPAKKFANNTFSLHLLTLYENSLGHLFDTYQILLYNKVPQHWAEYPLGYDPKNLKIHLLPIDDFNGSKVAKVNLGYLKPNPNSPIIPINNLKKNFFLIDKKKVSYKNYTERESDILRELFGRIKQN